MADEKTVKPEKIEATTIRRMSAPKHLRTKIKTVDGAVLSYGPLSFNQEPGKGPLQEVTIYPPPLYIMSPRMKIYRAEDIIQFKGYLHTCQPLDIKINEEGEPEIEATVTISAFIQEKDDGNANG